MKNYNFVDNVVLQDIATRIVKNLVSVKCLYFYYCYINCIVSLERPSQDRMCPIEKILSKSSADRSALYGTYFGPTGFPGKKRRRFFLASRPKIPGFAGPRDEDLGT